MFTALLSLALALGGAGQTSVMRAADARDDIRIRINGPVEVPAGDTASTVLVINDQARVNGVIRDAVVVVNGTARIAGRVEGDVVVLNGHAELQPGAHITGDVTLYRSTITRTSGAVILGEVHNETGSSLGVRAIWPIWLSFTLVVVLAGIAFNDLTPATLAEATRQLMTRTTHSALAALVVAIGVPALAMLSFATVIGIPLGLLLLFVVIPALTFLGYLVAGSALGTTLTARDLAHASRRERYATVAVGLVALQCAVALPVVGGMIGLWASLLGVGALAMRLQTRRRLAAVPAGPAVASA